MCVKGRECDEDRGSEGTVKYMQVIIAISPVGGAQFTAPAEVEYEHVEYALDPADPT